MFCELGFADLVERARSGARRSELAAAIPIELAEQLAALGTPGTGRRPAAGLPASRRRHRRGDTGDRRGPGRSAPRLHALRTVAESPHQLGRRSHDAVNTQCRLAARPVELPKASDWTIVEEPKPVAADGEFVVEVEYLSIDPAMRTWMNAGRSYVPPVEIGEVMRALGIGRVVESRHPGFAVGDEVSGVFGVQRYASPTAPTSTRSTPPWRRRPCIWEHSASAA